MPDDVRTCPCCGQPVNSWDYGAEVWEALVDEVGMTKSLMEVKD